MIDLTGLPRNDGKLYYLASPYSKYPFGIDAAYCDAVWAAAILLKNGTNVYSPILHTHILAKAGKLDPLDHDFWMRIDKPFVEKCDGLIVAKLPTWQESRGVGIEISAFHDAKKPIYFMDVGYAPGL